MNQLYKKGVPGDGAARDRAAGECELQELQILSALKILKIIHDEFTGSVVIHIHNGVISDFEKIEKALKKRREGIALRK